MEKELKLIKQFRLLFALVIVFGVHAVANAQVVYQQNESGVVAINAAYYTSTRDGSGTSSGTITTGNTVGSGDFINDDYLEFPTITSGIGDPAVAYTDAAAAYYTVDFTETGTYEIYAHMYMANGDADSYWFSADNTGSLARWETWTPNAPQGEWTWARSERADRVTISTTGEHTIEIYLRGQGGPLFDKFVLVKSGDSFDGDAYVANADLYDLTIDGTTVTDFDRATTTYNVELPSGTTSVSVAGTAVNDSASVAVTNNGTIDVSSGNATATIDITSEDGTATNTYTINFTVAADITDATLSDLLIDGTTVQGFSSSTKNYDVEMPYGTTSVEVTASTNSASANITSGTGTIDLTSGSATVNVLVTAGDGTTTETYTIDLTVYVKSTDATLSALSIDGTDLILFDPATLTYNISLNQETASIELAATSTDANADISGTGDY